MDYDWNSYSIPIMTMSTIPALHATTTFAIAALDSMDATTKGNR